MTERTTVALEQVYTRREIIGSSVKCSLQCSLAQDQKLSLYKKTSSTSSSSSDDVVVLRTRTFSQLARSTDGSICSLLVCLRLHVSRQALITTLVVQVYHEVISITIIKGSRLEF